MKKLIHTFLLSHLSLLPLSAQDTFSICAVDTVTGEVGSAGASCIDALQIGNSEGCALISDVHPGVGVVHTQAYYLSQNQTYAQSLMNIGLSPQQIIDSLQLHDIQNNPAIRQYGVVKLNGNSAQAASFTGASCMSYANHRVGANYAIQGNILLGAQILDSMEARFLNTPGDLACKLMAAMQGAKVPGADTRCATSGNSSLSAFLRVADANNLTIDLVVPYGPAGFEPIDSLQVLFDNVHACAVGINELQGLPWSATVYSNPVKDLLHVKLSENAGSGACFEMFNLHGQRDIIRPLGPGEELIIDCTALPKGIYYYRVFIPGKGEQNGKILIQ
jgi:uncharacterized Ntn-hydrolase superfamily protein